MAERTKQEASPQEVEELKIPDVLPLLPVRDVVVYPYMILPLFVGRELSIAAVDQALAGDQGQRLRLSYPDDDRPRMRSPWLCDARRRGCRNF